MKTNGIEGLQASLNSYFGFASARRTVAVTEEARLSKNALARARRLAAKHGIELERDGDGWWVTHPDLTDTERDPCQGERFCVGGQEVLACVEKHMEAL
jgi:hypothetical protein